MFEFSKHGPSKSVKPQNFTAKLSKNSTDKMRDRMFYLYWDEVMKLRVWWGGVMSLCRYGVMLLCCYVKDDILCRSVSMSDKAPGGSVTGLLWAKSRNVLSDALVFSRVLMITV